MSAGPPDLSDPVQYEAFAKALQSANPSESLGPIVIGVMFDLALLGCVLHQLSVYSRYEGKDRKFFRIIAYWSVLVTTAESGYAIRYLFFLFVHGFGVWANFFDLSQIVMIPAFAGLIIAPIQVFYLERAFALHGRKLWVIIVVAPLLLGNFAMSIATTVIAARTTSIDKIEGVGPWLYSWLALTLACDLAVTTLIVWGFSKKKSGWAHTDQLISSLIRLSVESQLPGLLYAIGFLLVHAIKETSQVNFIFMLQHPKVYVVSLLAVLNFRLRLSGPGMSTEASSGLPPKFLVGRGRGQESGHQQDIPLDNIKIQIQTHQSTYQMPRDRIGINRQSFVPLDLPEELPGPAGTSHA